MKKIISLLLAFSFLFSLLPALGLNAAAGGGTTMTIFSETFEDAAAIDERWTFTDVDGEANGWISTIGYMEEEELNGTGHYLVSASYVNEGAEVYFGGVSGVQTPDNLAISPEIEIPEGCEAVLTFDVFAVDPEYAAEKFSVYYDCDDPDCGDYDHVLHTERLDSSAGDPKTIVVNLSEYAGTKGNIIFRHHETSDEFMIGLDNVYVRVTEKETTEIPDHLEVEYNIKEANIAVGETVELRAYCHLPEGAENVQYQWYVAETPNQWGEAIVGATTDCYDFCGGMEETLYFRCQISCEVGGIVIGTLSEEFETIRVNVTYAGPPSMFFDDVKVGDWFYEDVEYVYYNRLMNGLSVSEFGPNVSTTRGMIVTILHRMEGEPKPSGACPFTDVAKGSYYETAIAWAAENDIVNGMGDGKFAPDDKITREQLAAIFFRYAKYAGIYDEDDCVMTAGFKDLNKISPWAQEAMSWAVGVGLIGGSNEADGLYIMPQGNALRCQVAAILHRFCDRFVKN